MNVLRAWFRRNFSNPQTVILALFLLGGFAIVLVMGRMLAPLLTAVVIAYLLEALVQAAQHRGMSRLPAVILVFLLFIVVFLFLLFWLVPLLSQQVAQLAHDLPRHIDTGQQLLMRLPEIYPQIFTSDQVHDIVVSLRKDLANLGQDLLSLSLAWIPSLIALAVYLILVPMLVFFFLKDKAKIIAWLASYLPQQRELAARVWVEVDRQIGNYIRGKFVEILIIGGASYITFVVMGLNYAALLGALVGLSVLIPYIGATVVTAPVAMIAYLQWGWNSEFAYLLLAYGIIQALDGNVVVPLLFSEAVNLHPVAIIVAVLVFGGLWGFWGVFFAIPLATLVKAVLDAWPRTEQAVAAEGG